MGGCLFAGNKVFQRTFSWVRVFFFEIPLFWLLIWGRPTLKVSRFSFAYWYFEIMVDTVWMASRRAYCGLVIVQELSLPDC